MVFYSLNCAAAGKKASVRLVACSVEQYSRDNAVFVSACFSCFGSAASFVHDDRCVALQDAAPQPAFRNSEPVLRTANEGDVDTLYFFKHASSIGGNLTELT